MMIFPVNITCNSSSNSYKFCSGGYGQEPSFWNNYFQYFVEGEASLALKDPIAGIEGKYLVKFKLI